MVGLEIIKQQWNKPTAWQVVDVEDGIEVSDDEGDFVMSLVTQNDIIEAVEEHQEKVKTEAVFKLLLDLSEDHEA
jgi:hypothetical protein